MSAITKISLLALIFVGGATLHGLSVSTGYYDLVNAHKVKGVLSDGALYNPIITGFGGLDDLLGTLVQFFYPCTDGTAPGLSLQSLLFSGQGFAFFIIWLLEGHRAGNKGRLISYVSIYGLLFQVGGLGLIGPAYLLLYVFTSPTVTNPSPSNLAINPTVLSGIPVALTLGFLPPTVFMSLPLSVISLQTKVKAVAAWQPVPIYITSLLQLWTLFSGSSAPKATNNLEQMKKLRTVYKYGLALAVPAHSAIWALSLSALVLPQIFTPSIAAAFHPLASIIPANPFTYATTTVPSMAQGAHTFLQWDYFVSGTAYLLFSLSVRFSTKVEPKGFAATDLAGLLGRIAVLGPMGTTLSYLWERDEIVLGKEEGQKKLR